MPKTIPALLSTGLTVVAIGGGIATLAGPATAQSPAPAPTAYSSPPVESSSTRGDIVRILKREYNTPSHRKERPMGSNCNYYSYKLGSGSRGCANGWRKVAWCADFARFIWKGARIDYTRELNTYADSFRKYGVRHRTWYRFGTYTPKPGDAVVYKDRNRNGLADHVGLVLSYNARTRTLVSIEGNWNNQVTKRTVRISGNPSHIWGFTKPLRY